MKKILFVCLGNICRSPLAEAILNDKIKQRGLGQKFQTDSCGTSNYHVGSPPDPRTVENAEENGIAIQHLGRQLALEDLASFDLILAMDRQNLQSIMSLPQADLYRAKIKLLREFDPQGVGDVPDPYHGGPKGFQLVFEMLDRSIENLLSKE